MRALQNALFPLGGFPACRRGKNYNNIKLCYTYLFYSNNSNNMYSINYYDNIIKYFKW